MSLAIKICGLKSAEAVEAALGAGADMIGLVFFPPSPRDIALGDAARLAEMARGKAEIVALTVNAEDTLMAAIVATVGPDWLQLHGKESPERIRALKARFGLPVMKALGVSRAEDLAAIVPYRDVADRLLFDAKPPKEATRPGGLGAAFDWSLLNALDPDLAFMLSGGLDIGNVAEAVANTSAMGLDVSTGVEASPGVKDPEKIRAFIATARKAEALKSAAERSNS